jgi:DNA invertase Pin-like site-specific DNA recombinase
METIRLLRSELERCHADLQTDEELFAEKVDELSEVQSAYSQLLREKERLEEMWLAAQEKEGTYTCIELQQF